MYRFDYPEGTGEDEKGNTGEKRFGVHIDHPTPNRTRTSCLQNIMVKQH
jgi:hypothetical protein